MPTTTSPAGMHTMQEALLPANSSLITALIDNSSAGNIFVPPQNTSPTTLDRRWKCGVRTEGVEPTPSMDCLLL
jgi:hypothetical protein